AAERRPRGGHLEREAPPRLDESPEDAREQEPEAEERDGVAATDGVLRQEEVAGEGDRCDQGVGHAEPVQRDASPEVDDEREPAEREPERSPDPTPDRLLHDEARPERDEQRAEVLDHERDADLEPVDREEVEELDERDAEHAEGGEEEELAARGAQRA